MDRYFTSMTVAKYLLDKGITVVGTLRIDRVGIPKGMKDVKGRAFPSTLYDWNEELKAVLVSYVVMKSKGCKKRHGSQYHEQIDLHNER